MNGIYSAYPYVIRTCLDSFTKLISDKSKFPQVELEPGEIQKLIDGDRASFIRRAKRLQEAASMSLKAIEARDTKALFSAIEHIDRACENCHLHYWYPKDSRALSEAKKSGVYEN